jgi:hypothetical protein
MWQVLIETALRTEVEWAHARELVAAALPPTGGLPREVGAPAQVEVAAAQAEAAAASRLVRQFGP